MQEKTVSIRNGSESVELLEAGSGSPLVFMHGAGGLNWDPFLEGLSQNYRVIAPRLPGTGNSTGDENLLNIHDLLYYLSDVLNELGIDSAVLVGHSLGGMIAAEMAAMEPGRYSKVVLIAPTGLWNEKYDNPDFFVFRSMPEVMGKAAFHDPSIMAGAPQPDMSDPEVAKTVMVDGAKNYTVAAKYLWPIPDKGLKNRGHRITSPTLIVWGKSDGIVSPEYANDFKALIPNSTVELFDKSGHMPQIEQLAELNEKVSAFLG